MLSFIESKPVTFPRSGERNAGKAAPPARPLCSATNESPKQRHVQPAPTAMQSLAFLAVPSLVFIIHSRLNEFLSILTKSPIYISVIVSYAALGLLLLSGGLVRALTNRIALYLILFTGWLGLTTLTSIWPGGSFAVYVEWLKAFADFAIVAGCLINVHHCRKALYAFALAGGAIAVQSYLSADESSERLKLGAGTATLGNPNDLAFYLVVSIPSCILILLCARRKFVKAAASILAVALLFLGFRTGSRGGLIEAAVLMAVIVVTSPLKLRLVECAAVAILGVAGISLAPGDVVSRYKVMVSEEKADSEPLSNQAKMAMGSTLGRWSLLQKSALYTLYHPLVGAGPGMFGLAIAGEWEEFKTQDNPLDKPTFQQPHNTYTQVSSESGILGLILYLTVLLGCFRAVYKMYRTFKGRDDLAEERNCAYCLFLSLAVIAVNGVFMGLPYCHVLPVMAGLVVALRRSTAHIVPVASPRRLQPGLRLRTA